MKSLKDEMKDIPPAFTDQIKETVSMEEDVILLRYADLKDKAVLQKNIEDIFCKHPMLKFINDTSKSMVAAMSSTEEMTDAMRWNQRKLIKRIGQNVYGMEAHFKVQLVQKEKSKHLGLSTSRETFFMVAYKTCAHSIEGDPDGYPDEDDIKRLTF